MKSFTVYLINIMNKILILIKKTIAFFKPINLTINLERWNHLWSNNFQLMFTLIKIANIIFTLFYIKYVGVSFELPVAHCQPVGNSYGSMHYDPVKDCYVHSSPNPASNNNPESNDSLASTVCDETQTGYKDAADWVSEKKSQYNTENHLKQGKHNAHHLQDLKIDEEAGPDVKSCILKFLKHDIENDRKYTNSKFISSYWRAQQGFGNKIAWSYIPCTKAFIKDLSEYKDH